MNKLSKILIVVVVILCVALCIMTVLIINARNSAKKNLDALLDQAEKTWEANAKINELEEQISNEQQTVNEEVFYAKIQSINEEEGVTTVNVKGLDVNDANHRQEFEFELNDNLNVVWNGEKIEASELEKGDTICITYDGNLSRMVPPQIINILNIKLLDDEK